MYITVADALKLPSFQNAQVVAGSGGLDRKIYRISVAECPEFPIDIETAGKDNQLFSNGDFFISSMFAIKDTPDLLLDTVKLYYQFNSSGLIVVRRYFELLPQEVVDYANEVNYPLIMLQRTTAYADVISDVMKAILSQQSNYTAVSLIDQILNGHHSEEKIEKLAYTLNHNFAPNILVYYIQCSNQLANKTNQLVSNINSENSLFAVNYYNNIIVFHTSENEFNTKHIHYIREKIIRTVTKYMTDYHIGISEAYKGLRYIKTCMQEALIACRVCRIINSTVESYEKIGTYRLLLEINNLSVLKGFYEQFVLPIKEYDHGKKGELFNTMISFAQNDGDIKKTAQELFQHENTIRYRLTKIKQLLNSQDDNLRFYESLAVVYKIYRILSSTEEVECDGVNRESCSIS